MSSFILSFFLAAAPAMASPNTMANATPSADVQTTSGKVILEAGESQILAIPSDSSLELNPKKIVEIEAAGKGQVRLIALRSGITLLKASSPMGEKNWIVEVLSRDQQNDWLLRSEWQSYFCARPGVHCDAERTLLSGEVDDLAWFYEAKKLCKKKMPCTWQVSLSSKARAQARIDLAPLMGAFAYHLNAEGQVQIESYCDESDKKALEKVLSNLSESYDLTPQIECLIRAPDLWLLDVLVVADREGSGDISNPLQWERIEIPSKQPLHAYISELAQANKMQVVAEPELSLSLGGTAILKDGQEIQTHAVQKDSEEILWKSSGFRLEIKLLEIKGAMARIQLKMNLSQPQAGLRTIDASEFSSELWLGHDKLQRIGRMQARLKGEGENRIPWLSAIPLFGALFRWESHSEAKSQLDIFLRIRRHPIQDVPSQDSGDRVDSPERESESQSPSSP